MSRYLIGQQEVAELLGWSRNKVAVYYSRNKLPKPYALVGGKRPVWTEKQLKEYQHKE